MNNRPIGVLDSGVGGLTVLKALLNKMPAENIIYYGDNAHVPYGNKTKEELLLYARNMVDFFISKDVKAVVFACNTNSSITLPKIKQQYDLPLLGVVKAGARAAAKNSRNKKIGVIATYNTVQSHAYTSYIQNIDFSYNVFENACPRLVPMIEAGNTNSPELIEALKEYLSPLLEKQIDTLVLGCTHYPYLTEQLRLIAGPAVTLVDPAVETVNELYDLLNENNLLNESNKEGSREFYVSGDEKSFYETAHILLPGFVSKVRKINLD